MNYTPKQVGETEIFSVDYRSQLAVGETIISASWGVTAVSGSDPLAFEMIVGSAAILGSKVSQMITGGVIGVTYQPKCAALTSMGQIIILPDPNEGYLQVVK